MNRRWRPRFSLLTLLLASLLCGSGALLWLHHEPWQVRMTIREKLPILKAWYSNDDRYILVESQAGPNLSPDYQSTVKTYLRETGALQSTINGPKRCLLRPFVSGGKYILGFSTIAELNDERSPLRSNKLWDATSGCSVIPIGVAADDFRISSISPRENFAVVYDHGIRTLRRLPSFEVVRTITEARDNSAVFSSDDKWMAYLNVQSRILHISALDSDAQDKDIQLHDGAQKLAFSPNGTMIAVETTYPTTTVYDIRTGSEINGFDGFFCAFSEDSRQILTATLDDDGGLMGTPGITANAKLWNIDSLKPLHTFRRRNLTDIRLVGNRVISATPFRVWDAATGTERVSIPKASEVLLSSDCRFMKYEIDNRVQVATTDGNTVLAVPNQNDVPHDTQFAFANKHAEGLCYPDLNDIDALNDVKIYAQRRPEFWYGYAWLPEFWLFVALAAAFVWSIVQPVIRAGAPNGPSSAGKAQNS